MSKTNGEIFAQFMHEAYGIEPEESVQEAKPTGPRRPAPVPEAGTAGQERALAEAEKQADSEYYFQALLNRLPGKTYF